LRAQITRIAWFALIVGALIFAVQGGEYSTLDLARSMRRKAQLSRSIDSLTRIVDSLSRYKAQLDTDPALQERIAREQFGMVRDKELLYQLIGPDSTSRTKPPRR
jgi:cell division protein FtsB